MFETADSSKHSRKLLLKAHQAKEYFLTYLCVFAYYNKYSFIMNYGRMFCKNIDWETWVLASTVFVMFKRLKVDGSSVVGTGGPELLYKQLYGLGYIVTKLYEKSLEVSEGLPLSRLTKPDTELE